MHLSQRLFHSQVSSQHTHTLPTVITTTVDIGKHFTDDTALFVELPLSARTHNTVSTSWSARATDHGSVLQNTAHVLMYIYLVVKIYATLDHMQATLLQTVNHTNTSSLNFYRPHAFPDAQQTVSCNNFSYIAEMLNEVNFNYLLKALESDD